MSKIKTFLLFSFLIPFLTFAGEVSWKSEIPDSTNTYWKKGVKLSHWNFDFIVGENSNWSFVCYGEAVAEQGSKILSCYPYKRGERVRVGDQIMGVEDSNLASVEVQLASCGMLPSPSFEKRLSDGLFSTPSSSFPVVKKYNDPLSIYYGASEVPQQGIEEKPWHPLPPLPLPLMDENPLSIYYIEVGGLQQQQSPIELGMEKPWHPLPPLPLPLMDAGEYLDLSKPSVCTVEGLI